MGIRRPKTLHDLIRFDANLRVTCPECGRSGVYPIQDVIDYFHSKGWNLAWEMVGSHFVCSGFKPSDPGCGHRGADIEMAAKPLPPSFPKPQPTEVDLKKEVRRRRG